MHTVRMFTDELNVCYIQSCKILHVIACLCTAADLKGLPVLGVEHALSVLPVISELTSEHSSTWPLVGPVTMALVIPIFPFVHLQCVCVYVHQGQEQQ